MSFAHFESDLLIGIYCIAEQGGEDFFPLINVLEKYRLNGPDHWLDRGIEGLIAQGYLKDTRDAGPAVTQDVWLTAGGARTAERLIRGRGEPEKGRSSFLDILEPREQKDQSGPKLASGKIYVSESDPPEGFGEDGDIFLTTAPASDRVVSFDHNSADHQEIGEKFAEVREAVRGWNEGSAAERDQVLASISAAQMLWNATQLRVVQIKVGILMAAEDAAALLKSSAKAVSAALLVDMIKSFVKNHFHIDLDSF